MKNTLINLKELQEQLLEYNNIPNHFYETFGECISDIEKYLNCDYNLKIGNIITDGCCDAVVIGEPEYHPTTVHVKYLHNDMFDNVDVKCWNKKYKL